MAIESIKCPECGGDKSTRLDEGKYQCEYCCTIFSHVVESSEQNNSSTSHCPYCGGEILFGAQKCPHCGEWLSRATPSKEETSPFPSEIYFDAIFCKSFSSDIVGEIFLTPDKLIFKPGGNFSNYFVSGSLSDRTILIRDIVEMKKGLVGGLTIILKNNKKFKFKVGLLFKKKVYEEIEARMKYLSQK